MSGRGTRSLATIIRSKLSGLRERFTLTSAFLTLERFVLSSGWMVRSRRRPTETDYLILTTVGLGNIGDQAMLDAVIDQCAGRVIVLTPRRGGGFVVPGHVEVVELEALIPGALIAHIRSLRRTISLIRRARHLIVIGADIMDGSYDEREAVIRFALLALSSRLGVDARVVGFSWSERPGRQAVESARRVPAAAQLFIRDPISRSRFERTVGVSAIDTCDVVFGLEGAKPSRESQWLDGLRTSGIRPLVINASGLLYSRLGESYLQEMTELCIKLLNSGWGILLVPHVVRRGDDDSAVLGLLEARLGSTELCRRVDRLLSPQEVQGLAAAADAVVTGRMHLAILALTQGTPPVVMGSQGKVTGMLGLFGLGYLEIDPSSRFASIAENAVRTAGSEEAVVCVASRIGAVKALSARNFRGI